MSTPRYADLLFFHRSANTSQPTFTMTPRPEPPGLSSKSHRCLWVGLALVFLFVPSLTPGIPVLGYSPRSSSLRRRPADTSLHSNRLEQHVFDTNHRSLFAPCNELKLMSRFGLR